MPKQRMLLLLFGLLLGSIFRLPAQTLGMNFYLEPFPATGAFNQPVGAAFAPDGRMFVIEKGGKVFIVKNGTKLTTPFIDLENEVLNHHDRGLLGIALDPNFASNGYVYLLYTYSRIGTDANHGTWARLTRYTASAANPDVADPASRWVMIGETWSDGMISIGVTHTIGSVRFGSDGTLLLTVGDGGEFDAGGNNPWAFGAGKFDPLDDIGRHRSQYLESMSGKVLRIDPATALGLPSNPFYTGNPIDYQSKVWTYGVRNPYRMSVDVFEGKSDPAQGDPGTLYLADVGEGTYEEMNIIPGPGMNFGWPCDEGPGPYPGGQNGNPAHTPCVSGATYDAPSLYFHHFLPNLSSPVGITGSAVIGGQRYRGNRYPANFKGQLFMGEYTEGWLAHVMLDSNYQVTHFHKFGENFPGLVGVEYDPFGDYLYTIDIATGTISRLRHNQETENAAPIVQASVQPQYGYGPLQVQFQASNSFDPNGDPFTYLWKFGDGDTSHQANPSHTYLNNGVYPVRLTLTDAFGDSAVFTSEVQVGNTPPVANMLSPLPEAIYSTQDSITVSGIATDAEDAEASLTYEWKVTQIHNDHQHPDFFSHTGKTASFSYEEHGYPFEVYFAQIDLIVSDPGELRDTVSRLVPISKDEESDITSEGTAIAKVTSPEGNGAPSLAVIHDSIFPPAGSTDPLLQYDTYQLAGGSGEDWIGYEFSNNRYFSRLTFQEGIHSANGGWLEDLRVEVRQAGQWIPVSFLTVFQPYAGEAAADFSLYYLDFRAETGDAIRIIGTPGGSSQFLSVAELRVHALPYQSGTPLITYFYPSTGDIGTEVSILGENFSSTSTVQFNAAFVDSFVVVNDTMLTTWVPNGAISGKITVGNATGTSQSFSDFTVGDFDPPQASILSPAEGDTIYGDSLHITYELTGDLAAYQADHIHFTLDAPPHITVHNLSGAYTITGLTNGPHDLYLQIVTASHIPLTNPEAADTISFVSVPKLTQSISFVAPANQPATTPFLLLEASSTSGLPVSFVLLEGPATISGDTLFPTGAGGQIRVEAQQAGNSQYAPAVGVEQTFFLTEDLFSMVGTASDQGNNCFQLTEQQPFQTGAIWANSQLDLGYAFSLSAQVYLGNQQGNGGDGLSFVLQRDSAGTSALGTGGSGFGAKDLSPAIGVSFDTYNGAFPHQVVLWKNAPNIFMRPAACLNDSCDNLDDGQFHDFQLDWEPNSQLLQVWVDGQVLITYTGDLVGQFFAGNSQVNYGFTAATGGALNEHQVCWGELTGGSANSLAQTITFDSIPDQYTTTTFVELQATATSGLPVSFSVLGGPGVVSGDTLWLTGNPGQVQLQANQTGDGTYLPAPSVERSFVVIDSSGNGASFISVGNTTSLGNECYQLTQDQAFQTGAAWSATQLDMAYPFSLQAEVYVGDNDGNGGDGMSFVLHNDPAGLGAIGLGGSGLGAKDISPAIGVSFDSYNGAYPHQVVLWKNAPNIFMRPAACLNDSCDNLDDGQFHDFQLDWDPAGQSLVVSVDEQMLITYTGDIVGEFFGGNSQLYYGFTAATGGATNEHRFCWQGLTGGSPNSLAQTITFDSIPDQYTTTPYFLPQATASSGLPVSFQVVSGPASISGDTLYFSGTTGSVEVMATQAGDATYLPAPSVSRSFWVADTTGGGPAFVVVGDAVVEGNDCYLLTPNQLNQAGAAWALDPLDLQYPFSLQADIYLGDNDGNGGDGMSFVMHQDSAGLSALGLGGFGLGARGISPSIGVSFDTYNGIYPHQVVLWKNQPNIYMRPASCIDGNCSNLDDGQFHQFQLDWDPNLQILQVYVDEQLLISYLGDLVNQFFGGNPEVIIGFTGGTGGFTNEQRFCWTGITGGQQGQLQDLNFPPIPDRYFSDGPLELTATASSGLPVSYEVLEGPAVLQGDSLLFTGGSGLVSVQASQAGDATYLPAIPIMRNFQLTDTTPPPNLAPSAVILLSPDSGDAALEVLFDGSASTDPEGDSLSFSWDLGDGNSDTQTIFSYTYDTAGVYPVVLTVSDGVNTSSDSATVWVFEPPVASCDSLLIDTNDFEGGFGIWNDGGADCALLTTQWANSGTQCVRLQDDSPTSVLTTDPLDLTGFSEIFVDFTYLPLSMGQPTDDFWLQISTDGGTSWTLVEEWNRDDEFTNKDRHFESIPIAGPFTANTLIRFRCDATNNGDHVYIDDISLRGCSIPARRRQMLAVEENQLLQVYPNPAESFFWLEWKAGEAGISHLEVLGLDGKLLLKEEKFSAAGYHQWKIDSSHWAKGLYLIRLRQGAHVLHAKAAIQ